MPNIKRQVGRCDHIKTIRTYDRMNRRHLYFHIYLQGLHAAWNNRGRNARISLYHLALGATVNLSYSWKIRHKLGNCVKIVSFSFQPTTANSYYCWRDWFFLHLTLSNLCTPIKFCWTPFPNVNTPPAKIIVQSHCTDHILCRTKYGTTALTKTLRNLTNKSTIVKTVFHPCQENKTQLKSKLIFRRQQICVNNSTEIVIKPFTGPPVLVFLRAEYNIYFQNNSKIPF